MEKKINKEKNPFLKIKRFFVIATDTDVGKTFVSKLLLEDFIKNYQESAIGVKPFCCGSENDILILKKASSRKKISRELINPFFHKLPMSPLSISLSSPPFPFKEELFKNWQKNILRNYPRFLIEGIGGIMTPITKKMTFLDIIAQINLPSILVIPNKLGALNHALLTLEAMRMKKLSCKGIILNNIIRNSKSFRKINRQTLKTLTDIPIIYEIEKGQKSL